MKIATWNINSVRLRAAMAVEWLSTNNIDVICFQELKCQNDQFPKDVFEQAGYLHQAVVGQKAWNGVAVLSKQPLEIISTTLPGDNTDSHARYLEVAINDVRIINIYAPNGNPVGTEKFPYKLTWLARLYAHAAQLRKDNLPFLICGDFNIIPEAIDCYDPKVWQDDALFRPETRKLWRSLCNLGLTDAVRVFYPTQKLYSFWDYTGGARQRNLGIRIDHFLTSPQLTDRIINTVIDDSPRDLEKPSDHVPVILELT